MSIEMISPTELSNSCQNGDSVDLVDVRTPAEFEEIHIPEARNVPLNRLNPAALNGDGSGAKERPVYLVCGSGKRAQMASTKLTDAGFQSVYCVDGGTDAWKAAGLPVQLGKKSISLERQVRLIAGSMIVIGSVLAMVLNPWWAILPAICGVGLLHAGVTDSCLMGLMLAPMPWNQKSCEICET